jgi:hypothetical protein
MMPKRRIFLIDKRFQLRLATRLIGYWVFMWSLVFGLPIVMVFGYQLVATRLPVYELFTGIISDFWFPVVMSLLVAPIVIRDSIRFSHRVAGPLFRLHRDLGLFLDGKPVQAIRLCPPKAPSVTNRPPYRLAQCRLCLAPNRHSKPTRLRKSFASQANIESSLITIERKIQ